MLLSTKLRMTLKMLSRWLNYGILKLCQGLGGGWALLGMGGRGDKCPTGSFFRDLLIYYWVHMDTLSLESSYGSASCTLEGNFFLYPVQLIISIIWILNDEPVQPNVAFPRHCLSQGLHERRYIKFVKSGICFLRNDFSNYIILYYNRFKGIVNN